MKIAEVASVLAARPGFTPRTLKEIVAYARASPGKLIWGITGIGHPDAIEQVLAQGPKPAAVQCIANLLDSPGGLKFYDEPSRPREWMAAARANGVAIMGIRAVQAGASAA